MDWRVHDRLEDCEAAWRDFERTALGTPFQSFDWLATWTRVIGAAEGHAPRILLGYEGDSLAVLVPLAVERAFTGSRLVWLGWQWSNYNAPLVAPWLSTLSVQKAQASLAALLRGEHAAGSYAYFPKQPALVGGLPNIFLMPGARADANPAYMFHRAPGQTRSLRSAKSLRRLRDKENALNRLGRLTYGVATSTAERRAQVGQLLAWKRDQLRARGLVTVLDHPAAEDFLAAVAACEGAGAEVHALALDDAPLAITFTLRDRTSMVVYQTAYDPRDLARYSPGLLLMNRLIGLAGERGLGIFDFSIGHERYKDELSNVVAPQYTSVLSLRPSGVLPALGVRGQSALKAYVKAHPGALALALGIRRLIHGGARRHPPTPPVSA